MSHNKSYFGRSGKQRLPRKFTEDQLLKIEEYAKIGMVEHQIAILIGISYHSLRHFKIQNKDFHNAIERGRSTGQKLVGGALFDRCKEGNIKAIDLYYKLTGRLTQITDNNEKELDHIVKSHDGKLEDHLIVNNKSTMKNDIKNNGENIKSAQSETD